MTVLVCFHHLMIDGMNAGGRATNRLRPPAHEYLIFLLPLKPAERKSQAKLLPSPATASSSWRWIEEFAFWHRDGLYLLCTLRGLKLKRK